MCFHEGVMGCQRLKFVWRRYEREPCDPRDLLNSLLSKADTSVQASAHSCPTQRKLVKTGKCILDALDGVLYLCEVTGEFLAESERDSVLSVSAADLDDVRELCNLVLERTMEELKGRDEPVRGCSWLGSY